MERNGLRILLAALTATLLVTLIDSLGGFRAWQEQALDAAQRHLPRDAAPMSSEIVMVDIDDRALERLGRWPWPRSDLAGALDELHRAGARTIAIDLDLADPQRPGPSPDNPTVLIDHDALLANACSDRVVLSVLLMPDELPDRWRDSGGDPQDLPTLLGRLAEDPDLNPLSEEVLPSAQNRAAAADTLHLLRRHAVFDAARSRQNREQLISDVGNEHGALAPIIELALQQEAARRSLPGTHEGGHDAPPLPGDRFPLAPFSGASGSAGYVNITRRGHDGGIRHLVPAQNIGHGQLVLPLGLAAARAYLSDREEDPVQPKHVRIGEVEIPINNGVLTVCWPRSPNGMQWPDLHRHDQGAGRFEGHLSIGEIVLLARARDIAINARQSRIDASRDVLRALRGAPEWKAEDWLDESLQSELAEEVSFTIGDTISSRTELEAMLPADDPTTAALMHRMLDWRLATQSENDAARRIKTVEESLRSQVHDRLVFVGWTATGTVADFVPTAAGPRTPGVMVHAALADMVLQDRVLREGPTWWSPAAAGFLGLLIAILVARFGPWPSTAAAMLVVLSWGGILVLLLWRMDMILPAVAPLIAAAASWSSGTGTRAVLVQRDKRRITRQFRARVPEPLVEALAQQPDAVVMSGIRREVCVMFGDLAGFTSVSEQMDAAHTVAMLNRCMAGLTQELTNSGAYLNKFLGDGFLAFWSAFGAQDDQADLACHAAMAAQKRMQSLNADSPPDQPSLALRIGIATGEAIVGDCGAPPILNDYTVIGDVVNLAARLESANKQLGTSVLIDGPTAAQCAGDGIPLMELGPLRVYGRFGVVDTWTIAPTHAADSDLDMARTMAAAIRSGDRNTARAIFPELSSLLPPPILDMLKQLIFDAPDPMPRALELTEK